MPHKAAVYRRPVAPVGAELALFGAPAPCGSPLRCSTQPGGIFFQMLIALQLRLILL